MIILFCSIDKIDSEMFVQFLLEFLGAFLGFLFALFLYYLQIREDREKQKKNDRESKREQLKYYILLVENNIRHLRVQLTNTTEFISEQKINLLDPKVMKHVFTNDCERIKIIDGRGVFEAFGEFSSEKDWILKYTELASKLDRIEGLYKETHRIFKVGAEKGYDDLLRIRDTINSVPDRLSSFAMEIALELKDRRFLNEYFKFMDSYLIKFRDLCEENADIETFNSQFLEPLLVEILKEHKHNPSADEIMAYCKKARVMMNEVRHDVTHTLSELEKIVIGSEKVLERIEELKSEIEKKIN